MIIARENEVLTQLGVSQIDFDDLSGAAYEHSQSWYDDIIDTRATNVCMTPDARLGYDLNGYRREADITQNAFEQYCSTVGVPSAYATKCYENGMGELAVENFSRWSRSLPSEVKLRTYGDNRDVHAVVSNRFTSISNSRIFELLGDSIDFGRYTCNQAYLSPEKMHLRFVDFDPLPGLTDRMFAGFTVSNNEVGRGALSVKFFLYRFACKNGIVRTQKGGTLFSQKHIGLTSEDEKAFMTSFDDLELLRENSIGQILSAQRKTLSFKEMEAYIERVRKECHLGKDPKIGEVSAAEWIGEEFGSNLWGVINFVTQKAQEYSLDDRLAMEQYAGNLLAAA